MSEGSLIYDKLITDFTALKFEDNSALFANVKKFYAANTMGSRDCLITPDTNTEAVTGQSAGNTATTRTYGFIATISEFIASTSSDTAGSIKYSRMMNIQTAVLNYIQKEPSNLNAWGQLQNPIINIFKMRLQNVIFDQLQTEKGYAEIMYIRFNVSLNVVPQLL